MPENPVALAQIRADLAEQDKLSELARDEFNAAARKVEQGERRSTMLRQLLELAELAYGGEVTDETLMRVAPLGAGDVLPQTTELAGVEAIDGMVMVLKATGRKMTLPEIADEMLRRGWSTKAEKPTETLRVALRRDTKNRVVHSGERAYYTLPTDHIVVDEVFASPRRFEPVQKEA